MCRKKNPKVKDRVIDAHKMKCPGTEQKPIHTGMNTGSEIKETNSSVNLYVISARSQLYVT